MHIIGHPAHDLPLFGAAGTSAIERRFADGHAPHTLMGRAGLAVARLALALAPHARCIWIAAGPGNNGGDGLEAATQLQLRGKRVQVTLSGDPLKLPDDARDALARAQAAGVPIQAQGGPDLDIVDLAVDALLGIGLAREPVGPIAALIERLNLSNSPVLAVDGPSGLNIDTGQPLGNACVIAQHTLSLLTLKPGLFTGAGRDHVGTLWFDSLGVEHSPGASEATDAWLVGADCLRTQMPPRKHAHHKGTFGDVAVVGGAPGMGGAALLAARAAHAAGAGRVFVNLLDATAPAYDATRPELMFRPDWPDGDAEALASSTVVCGCGGGDAVRDALPRLLGRAGRLVLDADALNGIAVDEQLARLLVARGAAGKPSIITPHPLEAARLLSSSSAEVQADRLKAANGLAQKFGCVVLLKGSGSIVAGPGCVPRINPTGNASLAGAGSGDVLAGWMAGLWAQRRSDGAMLGGFAVAAATAYLHGAAAEKLLRSSVRANDLIEQMHSGRTTDEITSPVRRQMQG